LPRHWVNFLTTYLAVGTLLWACKEKGKTTVGLALDFWVLGFA
jgi:hypothetical protein